MYRYADKIKDRAKDNVSAEDLYKDVVDDIQEGKLNRADFKEILKLSREDPAVRATKSLSLEDVIPLWSKTSADEKMKLSRLMRPKIENFEKNHPEKYRKLLPVIRQIRKDLAGGDSKTEPETQAASNE